MITINSDKGFIKVENWEDIESRPGFEKDLNPAKKKLQSIIGRYIFKDKIRCGLSNCHTPHSKGYIATTVDGVETNIGKDCGKKYFGVDFEVLSKKFDRDITEQENREKLWNFNFKLDDLEQDINQIRKSNKGADWANKAVTKILTRSSGCPDDVIHILKSMVKTRNNVLSIQREASAEEMDDIEAIQQIKIDRDEPHYIDEPVAEIVGLEALYPENNLRDLLIIDIENTIKKFKGEDIDQLSYEELREYSKWIGTIENKIDEANIIIGQARKFFTEANLKPFLKILKNENDISMYRQYLRNIN